MPDRPTMDDPPPFSCLALHGLGGGPYELAPMIAALGGAGVRVEAPTLPGHEGPGPIMPASDWREWADAAGAAFDRLEAHGAPVAVAGFSTGATLALLLAHRRPAARLVLLAPFLAIRFSRLIPIRPAGYLRPISRVFPHLPRRPPAARDPEARRLVGASALYRTFSLRAVLSALELIDEVRPLVPKIRTPTLILQGRRDTVVDPAGASWLADHLGSEHKELIWLPRSDHLLTHDHDRDRVIGASVAFLTGRDGPA